MLRAAMMFFVFGLVAMALGAYNLAGVSLELGKTLLAVFVVFAIISMAVSLINGRSPRKLL